MSTIGRARAVAPAALRAGAGTGALKPYLHVRRGLWAKVTRALFFDLVELGEEREVDGRAMFGVASRGEFFPMMPADQLKEFSERKSAPLTTNGRRKIF